MLETVTSITGIAGAGFRLSLILNAVNCEIANAPTEILTISKNVTLFSLLLKQTAAVLDQSNSVHSIEAIRVAEQILDESNAVFTEINAMLDKVRSKRQDGSVSPSIPQRIKWCFKKHGIEYLLGRLDRLQVSLSLMLQIIQLGTTMAATSRHDPPEKVREMSDKIRRERVEAQNVVVLYLFETQHLDRLYHVAKEEESATQSPLESRPTETDALTQVSTNDSQLSKVEEVVINSICDMTVQQPKKMLLDFDETWSRMADSKEDMVRVSEQAIDKLLEQWTRWRERRDQAPRNARSRKNGRHNPVVDDVYDDDENSPFFDRFQDREGSPNARLLEGPTTNWRQPHSSQARLEKRRRQRTYAGYQASVSAPGSEVDDSPSSTGSKKRPSNRHIIDSDEESSQSENERVSETKPAPKPPKPRRRSSAVTVPNGEKPRALEGTPISKSFNSQSSYLPLRPGSSSGRQTVPATWSQQPQQPLPQPQQQQSNQPLLPPYQPNQQRYQQRPSPVPDQNSHGHAISAPMVNLQPHYNGGHPPVYGSGMQSPTSYLPANQPNYPFPPGQPQTPGPPPRYPPPRLSPQNSQPGSHPPRPKSRDGKPHRSPSRLSREYQREPESRYRYEEEEEQRRRIKRERRSKFSDGAVKGLLAGGGLAVFLEALDALDL